MIFGTGSVYFRVISDDGSPMLMLEVGFDTFLTKVYNEISPMDQGTDYVHYGSFRAVRRFTV